jgi:hypothetical protein
MKNAVLLPRRLWLSRAVTPPVIFQNSYDLRSPRIAWGADKEVTLLNLLPDRTEHYRSEQIRSKTLAERDEAGGFSTPGTVFPWTKRHFPTKRLITP